MERLILIPLPFVQTISKNPSPPPPAGSAAAAAAYKRRTRLVRPLSSEKSVVKNAVDAGSMKMGDMKVGVKSKESFQVDDADDDDDEGPLLYVRVKQVGHWWEMR